MCPSCCASSRPKAVRRNELGDVNGDGAVNISDVTALINYLLTKDPSTIVIEAADLNGDQNVNISDATALINRLLTGQATPQ